MNTLSVSPDPSSPYCCHERSPLLPVSAGTSAILFSLIRYIYVWGYSLLRNIFFSHCSKVFAMIHSSHAFTLDIARKGQQSPARSDFAHVDLLMIAHLNNYADQYLLLHSKRWKSNLGDASGSREAGLALFLHRGRYSSKRRRCFSAAREASEAFLESAKVYSTPTTRQLTDSFSERCAVLWAKLVFPILCNGHLLGAMTYLLE